MDSVWRATLLLSTPTTHSVSTALQELTTGPSTWLCLCCPLLHSLLEPLVFRFRATSPLLNGYILVCQILTSPPIMRLLACRHYKQHQTGLLYIYSAFLSIWNLDFFRLVYTPFCLHPKTSTLQVLSLDYIYVKYLSVSFDILMPTFSWDMENTIQSPVVYYDGTLEYFGQEHLPYALLAFAVLIVFTFLPILLLCVYPCRCFHRCLNRYHLSGPALHTFMDTFQGSYKDGTNGTRDCRYFAAIYLMTRVLLYLSVGISIVTFNTSIISGVLLVVIVLLAVFQPYKESLYNRLDICLLVTLMVVFSSNWVFQAHSTWLEIDVELYLLVLISPIPLLYPLCLLSYHIWKLNILQITITQIKVIFQRSASHQQTEVSLPQQAPMTEATALLAQD